LQRGAGPGTKPRGHSHEPERARSGGVAGWRDGGVARWESGGVGEWRGMWGWGGLRRARLTSWQKQSHKNTPQHRPPGCCPGPSQRPGWTSRPTRLRAGNRRAVQQVGGLGAVGRGQPPPRQHQLSVLQQPAARSGQTGTRAAPARGRGVLRAESGATARSRIFKKSPCPIAPTSRIIELGGGRGAVQVAWGPGHASERGRHPVLEHPDHVVACGRAVGRLVG
jgi:hypothetical protein